MFIWTNVGELYFFHYVSLSERAISGLTPPFSVACLRFIVLIVDLYSIDTFLKFTLHYNQGLLFYTRRQQCNVQLLPPLSKSLDEGIGRGGIKRVKSKIQKHAYQERTGMLLFWPYFLEFS